jgi:hypothetical protein
LRVDQAFKEIIELKKKYDWLKCPESMAFIVKMQEDLPKVLKIIVFQEKQNAILRLSDQRLREYIKVNGMADECIIEDLKKKFNIDI